MKDSGRRTQPGPATTKQPEPFGQIRLGAVAAAADRNRRDRERQRQTTAPRELPPILRKDAFES